MTRKTSSLSFMSGAIVSRLGLISQPISLRWRDNNVRARQRVRDQYLMSEATQ